MDGFNYEDIMDLDFSKGRASRAKPVKRKWREIEAINDRRRLEKELRDMDIALESLDHLDL